VIDILDFFQLGAGKLSFELLDFDLIETVESTLDLFAQSAQSRGIELIRAIAPEVAGKSISLARWVETTVFLKFLENLPSLAVGHESGEYLAQYLFFCGRLVREEDHLLKFHPAMNGF